MGVDVVGGIPHFERTMADGAESVRLLCEFAAEQGLMVDMHCDETDDPLSRHIETLAYQTQRLGPAGQGDRLAPDLDAFDGQLLCQQAAAADRANRAWRRSPTR
jgi:cytosine/adenosine deaminase-related metal-dependent hydrolase